MKLSHQGLINLKKREGVRNDVYRDSAGYLTVGVGHLVKPGESYKLGQRISDEEVDRLLREDVDEFETLINTYVKVSLSQNQFDALVSLAYNIGPGGFRKSSVLRYLNLGQFEAAANAFLVWNKAGGKVSKGLVNRRAEEKQSFLSTIASNVGNAVVSNSTPLTMILFTVLGVGLVGILTTK
jgi:lysozyme